MECVHTNQRIDIHVTKLDACDVLMIHANVNEVRFQNQADILCFVPSGGGLQKARLARFCLSQVSLEPRWLRKRCLGQLSRFFGPFEEKLLLEGK